MDRGVTKGRNVELPKGMNRKAWRFKGCYYGEKCAMVLWKNDRSWMERKMETVEELECLQVSNSRTVGWCSDARYKADVEEGGLVSSVIEQKPEHFTGWGFLFCGRSAVESWGARWVVVDGQMDSNGGSFWEFWPSGKWEVDCRDALFGRTSWHAPTRDYAMPYLGRSKTETGWRYGGVLRRESQSSFDPFLVGRMSLCQGQSFEQPHPTWNAPNLRNCPPVPGLCQTSTLKSW